MRRTITGSGTMTRLPFRLEALPDGPRAQAQADVEAMRAAGFRQPDGGGLHASIILPLED